MKKILVFLIIIIMTSYFMTSCGSVEKTGSTSPKPSQSKAPTGSSSAPSPTGEMTDAEKLAAEYERIGQEALDNEHDHVWVFSHYQERHPHYAEYKCECGATKITNEVAPFTMTIVGKSEEHPHYMIEECSICKGHFVNENLPTELTWVLDGYTDEHPHYGKVKCSQCDYYEINKAITAENMGVSMLITEEATAEHPHYLIVKCTYPGCDYSYVEKNAQADWEYLTDPENYTDAHPHHLYGVCSYEGCRHETLLDETADWYWKDGVCSICGTAKDVKYTKDSAATRVTGLVDESYQGDLYIPSMIEGLPVESIEPEAFIAKPTLETVDLPDLVHFIGNSAFKGCTNLTLAESQECPITADIGEVYDSPASQPLSYFLEDYENGHKLGYMGSNTAFVEAEAFMDCTSLVSICFGENLIEIQPMAFSGCAELRHVFFLTMNAPTISPDIFENTSPELSIYVPAGAVGYDLPEWEQYEIVYFEMP